MKLEAKDIEAVLGGNAILRGVSLEVEPNEFVGIIGPNGSGKSTLLKCIYRVLKPQAGIVKLDGTDIRELSYKKSAQSIAVLAQHNYYNFEFSVQDVVLMGRSPHKRAMERDNAQDYAIVAQALETVGMADMAKRSFSTLSGGEQQRVILARALAQQTPCLILDEPTNHLDIASREWVEAAIEEFEGVLLFVSHDRYFIEKFAERIWLLEDGTVRDFRCDYRKYRSILEHEAMAKVQPTAAPKVKKEKGKPGGTKETEKTVRRLEREIDRQEKLVAELDTKIEAAAADYQELTRLLGEKEEAENILMELMEQWEQASAEME